MSDGRTHIPRTSRPSECLMPLPVTDRRDTVTPDPSLLAAGADEPKADPPNTVAADPSVIDAERDPLYGDRVKDDDYSDLDEELYQEHVAHRIAQFAAEREAEMTRRARLSRWQEQR